MLPPLTVEGISESVRFWLSDLPEVYEGRQVARGGRIGLLGNQDIFDTLFSVISYTSELIENQQARSVADIIRNDSSTLTGLPSQGYGESLITRGFGTAIFYDGLSLTIFSNLTVRTLKRVEVFKGPNALLNGATGAVGGSINLAPKSGRFDGKDAPAVPELMASLNLEWDAPAFPGLTLTARAEHTASQYIRNDNILKTSSYELYGIGTRYKRMIGDKQLTFRINIDNLLDEDYWTVFVNGSGALYLGSPRKINLSFTVDF